jgi:chaperone BCS1
MILTPLWTLIQHNQFIGGAGMLAAAGGLVAWARNLPMQLTGLVQRQFIVSVEVQSQDVLFTWISTWLSDNPYTKKSRALSASVDYRRNDERSDEETMTHSHRILFTPAPGSHVIRYRNTLVWVHRVREKEKTAFGNTSETFTFTFFGRSQQLAHDFFTEIAASVYKADQGYQAVFVSSGSAWESFIKRRPRPLDSIITRAGVKEALVDDLKNFIESRTWYVDRGLPYRRGYLLHGPPGNGKSSLVSSVAGVLKRDLYVLNLGIRDFDDIKLSTLMMQVPSNGILLIEDIDSAFAERDKNDEHASTVTFSGLLNALDGVSAKEGQIVIMSTNHIERLDPALIRPGRIDHRVLLENANSFQAEMIYRKFYPGDDISARAFGKQFGTGQYSMASLQNELLTLRQEIAA